MWPCPKAARSSRSGPRTVVHALAAPRLPAPFPLLPTLMSSHITPLSRGLWTAWLRLETKIGLNCLMWPGGCPHPSSTFISQQIHPSSRRNSTSGLFTVVLGKPPLLTRSGRWQLLLWGMPCWKPLFELQSRSGCCMLPGSSRTAGPTPALLLRVSEIIMASREAQSEAYGSNKQTKYGPTNVLKRDVQLSETYSKKFAHFCTFWSKVRTQAFLGIMCFAR